MADSRFPHSRQCGPKRKWVATRRRKDPAASTSANAVLVEWRLARSASIRCLCSFWWRVGCRSGYGNVNWKSREYAGSEFGGLKEAPSVICESANRPCGRSVPFRDLHRSLWRQKV